MALQPRFVLIELEHGNLCLHPVAGENVGRAHCDSAYNRQVSGVGSSVDDSLTAQCLKYAEAHRPTLLHDQLGLGSIDINWDQPTVKLSAATSKWAKIRSDRCSDCQIVHSRLASWENIQSRR